MAIVRLMLAGVMAVQSGTLQFTAPPAWKSRPAASSMRVAELIVPRVPGDAEDGEVIVYFFGGSGGTVDANVERWIGQFRSASGEPLKTAARTTSTIGKLKVTQVDVSGTYIAEVRPGSAERFNKPNFRMRAAVVETPKGPYFIKFTGPSSTVAQASGDFDRFLKSVRLE